MIKWPCQDTAAIQVIKIEQFIAKDGKEKRLESYLHIMIPQVQDTHQ
jgi:hypothetical protein